VHAAGKLKWHYGWVVVAITFATLVVSAGVRSMPGILMLPLADEFDWSRSAISSVMSVGIFLYGMMGPFAASLLRNTASGASPSFHCPCSQPALF